MPFGLTYVRSELARRKARAIVTALGLAAGVALVLGIVGISRGLTNAQNRVLTPLKSVGTDVLVTRVAGDTSAASSSSTTSTTAGGGFGGNGGGFGGRGGGFFGGGGGGQAAQLNTADAQALLNDSQSVVTDLSKLGKPGDKFTHDFFLPATLLTFPDDALSQISKIPGVSSAVGGLSLLATHQTGTVPQIVASVQTGGQTITQTVRPDPMTDAEREAFRACVAAKQGSTTSTTTGGGGGAGGGGGGQPPDGGGGRQFGGGGGGFRNPAFEDCLPERFRQFQAQFVTPLQTIRQAIDPPQTDITSSTYTAAGIDPAHPDEGLVTRSQLTDGAFIRPGEADQVLASVAYAGKASLKVGSTLPINGKTFTVVGLVDPSLKGNTADLYFPIATLQDLSGKSGRLNEVLVKARDSASVDKVAKAVGEVVPGAKVVTTKSLADQVTGSLADTKSIADRFGGALAVIVLLAAFAIAVLLTLGSVGKRVREIGTLRAIGWPKRMVVRQILSETMVIGVIGALAGVALGIGVGALVGRLSPTLTATSGGVPGLGSSPLARILPNGVVPAAGSTTHVVHLTVPVDLTTVALGIALAILGGLVAGAIGGWRAARLQPAVALRDLG